MPYGRKQNYKGRSRKFTSVQELESQRQQEQREREWRSKNKDLSSSEEEESDSEEDEKSDTHNPNRVVQKSKKLSELTEVPTAPAELSRKEKEEIAKQESARRYQQLHAQGKTDEARADLARLAIIRKQREEAAKKREEEKKDKETRLHASKEASLNAIKAKDGRGKRK